MAFSWNTTNSDTANSNSITVSIALCDNCNKRYHDIDDYQCDYCWDYYNDVKFYSCRSPDFIGRKWLRICYRMGVPYNVMRFFFRRDVARHGGNRK